MALLVIGIASALVMRSSMIDKVDNQLQALAGTVDLHRLPTQVDDPVLPSNYVIFWLAERNGLPVIYAYGVPDINARPPLLATAEDLLSKVNEPYTVRAS